MRMRIGLLILAVVAAGSGLATTRSAQEPPGTLKVMTFNIQHGLNASGKYNLQGTIDTIAKAAPDIVGLQEVTRNHPYYKCDDQPKLLADGLKAATGREWHVVYEQEWFTPNVECQQSGQGDGKETEGLAFLSPSPLGAPETTSITDSRIVLAVKPPSLGGVAIAVTHFTSGHTKVDKRQKQVDSLLSWMRRFDDRAILMGDFNGQPDASELQPLFARYQDAWAGGTSSSVARGDGITHGVHRLDYIFFTPGTLQLTGIEAIDTRSWFKSASSDHRPVVATFRLRPAS